MSLRLLLLAAFAYVLLLVILALEVPLALNVSRRIDAEVKAQAAAEAQLVAASASGRTGGTLDELVGTAARQLRGRVIVVDERGVLVSDSAGEGLLGTNYGDRPEIREALATDRTAQGRRPSETLGQEVLYTAAPIVDEGRLGAVRITQSVRAIDQRVRRDVLGLVAVGLAALAFGLVFAWVLAGRLSRPLRALASAARRVEAGDLEARAEPGGAREQREVAEAFNDMAERIESLFDARTQLVAWASHDLRTPLANMQAMLEALEDGLVEPDHYLDALHEQTRTLARLVDDLFELARIDAGVLTLELRDAQLSGLVYSCLRGLEAEARARGVHLTAELGDAVTVHCAPDKVERVLLNLLTNSLRHTPADGSVAVMVEPRDDEVQVTIEDTGSGLEPASEQHVFERFWRGDRARSSTRGGGAGLGLTIARGLVEAHGGRIWAESRPGGGARVSFTLPAAPSAELTAS
jgi:signal transduction histidine kinase